MPHIDTVLAQAGRGTDPRTGAISTPVYQTSTYAHPGLGQSTGFDYSRSTNPTRKALEDAMATLDRGAAAFAFGSGLAALSTLLCLLSQGDHLVVAEGCYGGTYRLLDRVFERFGLAVDYVPVTEPEPFRTALRPQTRMILVESVSNPCLEVPDIPALVQIAREAGVLLAVDNTMLTPCRLRPLEQGADLVLHSASKFLSGHNDTIAGIVSVRDPELAERLGYLQNAVGAVLGPQDAWLVLRGLKTLALRPPAANADPDPLGPREPVLACEAPCDAPHEAPGGLRVPKPPQSMLPGMASGISQYSKLT